MSHSHSLRGPDSDFLQGVPLPRDLLPDHHPGHRPAPHTHDYHEAWERHVTLPALRESGGHATRAEPGGPGQGRTGRAAHGLEDVSRESEELRRRVSELQERLRFHLSLREDAEQRADSSQKKLTAITADLASRLGVDAKEAAGSLDKMMSRISELREEHFQQQTRIAGLTETLANQEREFKASRETIMKLVGDVSQERRAAAASAEELAALRRERDEALAVKTAVQREVRLLQERLEESRRGWAETRQQLQGAATRAERAEDDLQGALRENGATRTLHGSLLCQLAALLGNGVLKVPETEEGVLERVRELCSIAQGRRQKEQEYERELRRANEQLEQQGELHQQSLARARHAETLLSQHKDTLRHTEESLAARHLLQETLSHEKKQHQHFVEVMAQTLAVEEEVLGRPPQLQYDTLLTRVQGLATEAQQSGPDLRELLVALQKKVVSQKAKLERRQAEIETLQQEQLRAAEESRRSREMSLSRATLLQAQDQHRAVEELNGSLLEARRQREAAEERAAAVRAELEVARREARQGWEESQRVLALQETLCEQLRVGQRALREVARRERALVDFRVSVLRVLGLDASGASVPDSLLLARLEKCVSEQRPVKTDGSPKRSPGPNPPATATVTHVISGKAAHTVRGP